MILTFELNKHRDEIEIIFNNEGLRFLKSTLDKIDNKVPETDHLHLNTKEWGGSELTSEVMHQGNTIVNHVKVVFINED